MKRSSSIRKSRGEGRKGTLWRGDIANVCLLLVCEKGSAPESIQTYEELFDLVYIANTTSQSQTTCLYGEQQAPPCCMLYWICTDCTMRFPKTKRLIGCVSSKLFTVVSFWDVLSWTCNKEEALVPLQKIVGNSLKVQLDNCFKGLTTSPPLITVNA